MCNCTVHLKLQQKCVRLGIKFAILIAIGVITSSHISQYYIEKN